MAVPPRPAEDQRFQDARAKKLAALIEPTVAAHGLHVDEVAVTTTGQRTVLQVSVDYQEGTENVDLDTIAGVSEALSVVLDQGEQNDDAAAPLAALETYDLEVSTPGATRPLTEPRHFRRNVGRLLEIDRTADERSGGAAALTARLNDVDDEGIVVAEIKPPPKKGMKPKIGPDTHISFGSIARARVQVEFSHKD
ncbi:ribosome maturation factor RimP [Nesterenkonia salmonea]|uniref:Ribosome maturation factor RimP n=1 Tax=Nesterenkonia salmonea TaxID=1804987 RepID=A0A5R9BB99_9MICC|nr:ribosome maturation factor RimP [Nesterenkonia salmonea]TLP97547.1 ribosome maturation factor RimP [Nesterenkonia salmonea]